MMRYIDGTFSFQSSFSIAIFPTSPILSARKEATLVSVVVEEEEEEEEEEETASFRSRRRRRRRGSSRSSYNRKQ